ncbi:DNA-3-methyladenine glycosylase I [Cavenderia fasciculata]|uniref:DNA-3-methyladenine glycosylase I n=1 Tax=Cavenderia fasciculata TaxID=261658 RepID=F4Q9F5_CACFS|nr:DNA-3-methyladenine glycosylase I [Cavenderia fasciculata]EGG15324.1 DNA-3-methyladenine glycosylase I [Cavenderia fasciculata]|eukprot:XP_004352044.1 DNA-3-methyladenine glycosylase I [Cavenderia fasciculata]
MSTKRKITTNLQTNKKDLDIMSTTPVDDNHQNVTLKQNTRSKKKVKQEIEKDTESSSDESEQVDKEDEESDVEESEEEEEEEESSDEKVVKRCGWVPKGDTESAKLYQEYHDNEWGTPQYDSDRLFEKVLLEGQHCGLSWLTVLLKRKHYKEVFHNFDAEWISKLTDKDIDRLMNDQRLIRNRLKLKSIVSNAKAYLKIKEAGVDFSSFMWSFVGGKPNINHRTTTCYALMQSCGMIDDHSTQCFRHSDNLKKKSK